MWQTKSFRNRIHSTNVDGWMEGRSINIKKMKTCSGTFLQGLGTFFQGLLGLPAWQPWLLSHPHPVTCECCVYLDRGFKAKHFWTCRNSFDLLLWERSLGNNCPPVFLFFFFCLISVIELHEHPRNAFAGLCWKKGDFAHKAAVESWQTPLINETTFPGVLISGAAEGFKRCSVFSQNSTMRHSFTSFTTNSGWNPPPSAGQSSFLYKEKLHQQTGCSLILKDCHWYLLTVLLIL